MKKLFFSLLLITELSCFAMEQWKSEKLETIIEVEEEIEESKKITPEQAHAKIEKLKFVIAHTKQIDPMDSISLSLLEARARGEDSQACILQ
jgi:hypothetical protein